MSDKLYDAKTDTFKITAGRVADAYTKAQTDNLLGEKVDKSTILSVKTDISGGGYLMSSKIGSYVHVDLTDITLPSQVNQYQELFKLPFRPKAYVHDAVIYYINSSGALTPLRIAYYATYSVLTYTTIPAGSKLYGSFGFEVY